MDIINKERTNDENVLQVYFDDDECWEILPEDAFEDVEGDTTIYFIRSSTNEIERVRHVG